jgi:hypothetical protein
MFLVPFDRFKVPKIRHETEILKANVRGRNLRYIE